MILLFFDNVFFKIIIIRVVEFYARNVAVVSLLEFPRRDYQREISKRTEKRDEREVYRKRISPRTIVSRDFSLMTRLKVVEDMVLINGRGGFP